MADSAVRCYMCRLTLDANHVRSHVRATGHCAVATSQGVIKCGVCINPDIRELTVTKVGAEKCVVLCRDRCSVNVRGTKLPNENSKSVLVEDGDELDLLITSNLPICSIADLLKLEKKAEKKPAPRQISPQKQSSPTTKIDFNPLQTWDEMRKEESKQEVIFQTKATQDVQPEPSDDQFSCSFPVAGEEVETLRRMPDVFVDKEEYKSVIEAFLMRELESDRKAKSANIRTEASEIVWKSGARVSGEVVLKSVKELHPGDKLTVEDSSHTKVIVSVADIGVDSSPTKVSFKGEVTQLSHSDSSYVIDFRESVRFSKLLAGLTLFADSNEFVNEDIANIVLGKQKPANSDYAVGVSDLEGLNESQVEAVRYALTSPFALIQGPPGTGKTKTAAAIIQKLHEMSGENVLVCAPSNIAVDQLTLSLSKLPKLEGKILRIYAKSKIDQGEMKAEEFSLHRKVRELLSERYKPLRGLLLDMKNDVASVLSQANVTDNLKLLEESVVSQHQIVCCTCASSLSRRLKSRYEFLLVDEAGFASEADTILPLLKNSSHVVLVGDHQQLPPAVFDHFLTDLGYGQSLFERLINTGIVPALLKFQFRMHPDLSDFPSKQFYRGLLQNGVSAADRILPEFEEFKQLHKVPKAVVYFHVSSPETKVEHSYCNTKEVSVVLGVLAELQRCGISDSSIGVISPYEAQTATLAEAIQSDGRVPGKAVEIKNVDGFQGREKDIIIFTSVRSNESSSIGFLCETRRLNVAITRARFGLIMVGNKAVLSSNKYWRAFISTLEKAKCIRDGPLSFPS